MKTPHSQPGAPAACPEALGQVTRCDKIKGCEALPLAQVQTTAPHHFTLSHAISSISAVTYDEAILRPLSKL